MGINTSALRQIIADIFQFGRMGVSYVPDMSSSLIVGFKYTEGNPIRDGQRLLSAWSVKYRFRIDTDALCQINSPVAQ